LYEIANNEDSQPTQDRLATLIKRIFQNRNLGLLWFGQMASQSGDSIYQIGLLWITLELTGSESVTGLVAMASYLPAVILSLLAGVVADRFNRLRVMIFADATRLLLVLAVPMLALFDGITPLFLGINAFAIAIAATFFNPARDAIVPQIVPEARLVRANSLIQTSWQLSMLIGPGIAGWVLFYFGKIPLFWAAAATYALSLGTILAMRVSSPKSALAEVKEPSSRISWADILHGLRFAVRHKVIGPLLLITIADNIFIMGPAIVGTPVFIKNDLRLGADSFALIEGCYAIGMLIGTGLLLGLGKHLPKGKVLLVGMVLDGITFIPIFWVESLLALEITIIVHSLAIPMLTVTRASLIQSLVPREMTGQIFALVNIAVVGMSAISAGLAGIALEAFGARYLFFSIGIGGGLCGVAGWIWARELRASK